MKKTLAVLLAIMLVMGIFCSCGAKKYNGFELEGDKIILPLNDEIRDEFDLEGNELKLYLSVYKTMEATLKPVVADLVAFKPVSDAKIDLYGDYIDTVYNEFLTQLDVKTPEKALTKLEGATEDDMYLIDELFYFVKDYAWEVKYILNELADQIEYSYYDSMAEFYEEETEDVKAIDKVFMKVWFPQFTYLTTYEETAYAKENPAPAKSISSSIADEYSDALNSVAKEYENALNSVAKEYEDALNDLDLGAYADLYSDTLDAYSDIYSDSYSDALNSYSNALDSYANALDSLGSFSW